MTPRFLFSLRVPSVSSIRMRAYGEALALAFLAMGFPSRICAADGAAADLAGSAGIRSATVATSAIVPRRDGAERFSLLVTVESGGLSNVTVRLSAPAWADPVTRDQVTLASGKQIIEMEVPSLTPALPVTVQLQAPEAIAPVSFGPFPVHPPRRWTVYLSQHTHTDIGYTRPQTEILPEHLRYIDYALDFCDQTDRYPDDARFRWTCETAWAVREYLARRPAAQVERLKRRAREGRIEICGLLLNMSEIASESALGALLRPVRTLKEAGLPVVTAMQNDVNGAGWCLPDYFASLGVRYLSMGINQTRSILPFDQPTPFWWESPSGKRVLAYRSDHYMTANFWGIEKGALDPFKPKLRDYLRSLEERRYPLDRVGVQFSGYFTDNSPPSTVACDLVQAWNERYAWPKLRLSTSQEFLAYVEKEKGGSLPVHRQAWPDWWTDGFGSAARETAAARETEAAMQVNYGLLAMAALAGVPVQPSTLERAAAIQDDLLFYHEHTFGAAESISDPLAENAQVQWGEKASYVWTAVKNAHQLREEAHGLVQDLLPRAHQPTLAVFNTLNWPRSGLVRVFIDHEILPADRTARILDGDTPVLAQPMEQRAEGTYWALWVRDVPPLGYRVLRLERGEDPRPAAAPPAEITTLENGYYRLRVDPTKGALTSLEDVETGMQLVDAKAEWALGQCVYETMPANREMKPGVFQRQSVRNVKVTSGAQGPVWKSLLIQADMEGCATNHGVRAEIRLYEAAKRIELHYAIRKLGVPTPEAVYVALPFQVPGFDLCYEAQGGAVRPGKDQLPGSSSDWQTWQSYLAIRHPSGQVIVGSDQAPLVQLGDFNLGKWQPQTRVERPHIYSWVMNNYWFTNFRTEQEGEFKWHYYLTSSRDASAAAATQFGWGSRIPLVARVMPGRRGGSGSVLQASSALSARAPNVLVVESRPARQAGGIVFHLRELMGQSVTLTAADVMTGAPVVAADEVSVVEEVIRPEIESMTLQPYEVKFVRLRLR